MVGGSEKKTAEVRSSARKEENDWLKRCGIAELRNYLQIGGLRVLIECASPEDLTKLLTGDISWYAGWFTHLSAWTLEQERVRPGRVVWLNLSSVPLHAWHVETFQKIASLWGTVIEVEDLTGNVYKRTLEKFVF